MVSFVKQDVMIPVGNAKMPAYLVYQDDAAKRPGVIVFQEIFGVNSEMRRIADLLGEAGYVALVPNFYHRTAPNLDAPYNDAGMAEGLAAAGATSLETLLEDVNASLGFMQKQRICNGRIGAWGFCFGGTVAYLAATVPGIEAAVSFYGGQIAVSRTPQRAAAIEVTKDIKAPIMLAFGGKDQSITSEHIAAIASALQAAGKPFELEVYPEEGHAFFRNGVNGESTAGARDAWPKVKRFLEKNLA